ncbi:MAG: type II toxin-antitoxin system RelE/ParE family toxin [Planctomycetes bacterium]|nr:type II toxin-antitoxin system RelE/ParE family toxin [Planctomycetota bacterium]MCH9724977.1 type II toxin-antitoxin system RelE/ParE family toxin [Planctomycetota bacterium]MCH9777562.1 type II toxin-antitoxin system RelE/ParE family toxin [Planctomycetota bacterium]MCH9790784.1 type II toxin-antitoxin system RelE/ParE family toxin [Planctomycetota bacterium]
MTFRVELSRRAETDIKRIYAYIRKHGPADPKTWKDRLKQKLSNLEQFPEACSFAPENEYSRQELRQALYGPFRIIFTTREQTVFVISIRHAARLFLQSDEIDKIK